MPPLTSIHANPLHRRTVLCTGCNTSVYPTRHRWKPISQLCLACDIKKNNVDALTVAQHGETAETVDDDHPEHRATGVRRTIRFPPRRLCTEVVLGKGAHVIITRNLWQQKGLGLLVIEKLDWERVKKLDGKFLHLRLEDIARRYPGT
jgi:hypothetical protein